jgi:hypothetical protein
MNLQKALPLPGFEYQTVHSVAKLSRLKNYFNKHIQKIEFISEYSVLTIHKTRGSKDAIH